MTTQVYPSPVKRRTQTVAFQPGLWILRALFRSFGSVAPNVGGALAMKLWFTPSRHARPKWEVDLAASADERYTVESPGLSTPVWAWGQGPTIMLVHGWAGRGTQLGNFVRPLTARGFRVVCFDLPAHGDAAGKQTDALEQRQVIEAVAAREDRVHGILTHSFGAMPTALALRGGLWAERVVFISPPSHFPTMLGYFQRHLRMPLPVVENLIQRIQRRFPTLGADLWEQLSTHVNARHFRMPGLLIHDIEDQHVPAEQGRLVARAWPGATLLETVGLGHRRILRDPAILQRVGHFFGEASTG
jgi:pimeloyl-ACP methyl ester carboxylesterase